MECRNTKPATSYEAGYNFSMYPDSLSDKKNEVDLQLCFIKIGVSSMTNTRSISLNILVNKKSLHFSVLF